MDFDYSPKTKELQARVLKFMDDYIYPSEAKYKAEMLANVGSSRVDLQACKLEYSIVSPK